MNQIMVLDRSRPEIGLSTRPATHWDEFALVKQFIDYYCNTFVRNNKKTRLAVFVEPRIDSGFPDVVFASYLPSIIDKWVDTREALDIYDLKLLSYLYSAENMLGAKLISTLGMPQLARFDC